MKTLVKLLTPLFFLLMAGCSEDKTPQYKHSMQVSASAYNSLESQTKKGDPTLTAWGHTLKPGMKAIAVSRDLIEKGLTNGTEVKIEGLDGTYRVLDKMNKRWKDKIDIYMGNDVEEARKWGKRTVTIYWN